MNKFLVGDLVTMKVIADTREFPPKGIILESNKPDGHRFAKHTIVWNDGVISEIPEDILKKVE